MKDTLFARARTCTCSSLGRAGRESCEQSHGQIFFNQRSEH